MIATGHRYMTVPEAYAGTINEILSYGHRVSPRGMQTREIIGHSFTVTEPRYNIVTQATRKVSLPFMAAEFLWMITGSNDARLIVPYNSVMAKFSDDGIFFRGAYGPKLVDQLPYVIETLTKDQDSRQALLTLWRERPGPSKDIPCTVAMQFFIRNNLLDMVVYMRSNDAWLGLPYDIFNFTMIQRYVASLLDIDIGWYHHHVGSMHLYEEHWAKGDALVLEGTVKIPTVEVDPLMAPIPPEVHTVFTGISYLGERQGVTPEDVNTWLDLSGAGRFTDWLYLLKMCAYRFHKDPRLLPENLRTMLIYQDQYLDEVVEQAITDQNSRIKPNQRKVPGGVDLTGL